MGNHAGRKRPFPAVAIVFILLLLCLFPGQHLVAGLLPSASGIAKIDPGVVIMDIPVHIPFTIEPVLVFGLFLLLYPLLVLAYPTQPYRPSLGEAMQRTGTVLTGLFIVLFCVGAGGLIAWVVQGYLPRTVRNAVETFGINTDIRLPYASYGLLHLHGNVIVLVCLIVGLVISIRKIGQTQAIQKTVPLTREQRKTPYKRMIEEKKGQGPKKEKVIRMKDPRNIIMVKNTNLPARCQSQQVLRVEPESVAYMPM